MNGLRISVLPGRFAISRLAPDAAVPPWVSGRFTSVTRTPEELSVICEESAVPGEIRCERGWRAVRVEGPIPFETTGLAAALTAPLAAAGIPLLLIATFDTDYLLVRDEALDRALPALTSAGFLQA